MFLFIKVSIFVSSQIDKDFSFLFNVFIIIFEFGHICQSQCVDMLWPVWIQCDKYFYEIWFFPTFFRSLSLSAKSHGFFSWMNAERFVGGIANAEKNEKKNENKRMPHSSKAMNGTHVFLAYLAETKGSRKVECMSTCFVCIFRIFLHQTSRDRILCARHCIVLCCVLLFCFVLDVMLLLSVCTAT